MTVAELAERLKVEANRADLQSAVNAAKERFAAANRGCEPYDAAVVARETVAAAKETRRAAHVRLSDSGLRHRRARRADLAIADDHLDLAEQKRAEANDQAAPTNRTRTRARRDLSAAREALRTENTWDRWNHHPERRRHAETRIDALDTCEQWAQGRPLDREQLAHTVEALSNSPHAHTNGALALANAVHHWASQNNIDIRPITTPLPNQWTSAWKSTASPKCRGCV